MARASGADRVGVAPRRASMPARTSSRRRRRARSRRARRTRRRTATSSPSPRPSTSSPRRGRRARRAHPSRSTRRAPRRPADRATSDGAALRRIVRAVRTALEVADFMRDAKQLRWHAARCALQHSGAELHSMRAASAGSVPTRPGSVLAGAKRSCGVLGPGRRRDPARTRKGFARTAGICQDGRECPGTPGTAGPGRTPPGLPGTAPDRADRARTAPGPRRTAPGRPAGTPPGPRGNPAGLYSGPPGHQPAAGPLLDGRLRPLLWPRPRRSAAVDCILVP